MEEDEDVILQGSALYTHLQNEGFTNFEISESQNVGINLQNAIQGSERKAETEKRMANAPSYFGASLLALFGIPKVEKILLHRLALKLIRSRLLEKDDIVVLECLSQSLNNLSLDPESSYEANHLSFPTSTESAHSLLLPSIIVGLFGCIMYYLLTESFDAVLFSSVVIVIVIIILVLKLVLKYSFEQDVAYLEAVIDTISKLEKLVSRTLKTITELKVIGRPLSSKSDSSWSVEETSYEISLSSGVSVLMETASLALIASHREIVGRRLSSEWGSSTELFDHRFQPLIHEEIKEMSTLKKKRNALFRQCSVFLTELLLHLERDYKQCMQIDIASVLVNENIDAVIKQIDALESVYSIAKNFWFKQESIDAIVRSPKKSYESVKTDVDGALDTLYIHSRLAVNHILFLKQSVSSVEDGKDILTETQKSCDTIKHELLSCIGCLVEVKDRSQRRYRPDSPKCNSVPANVENEVISSSLTESTLSPILNLTDYIPEDEVYEISVEEDSSKVDIKDDNADWVQHRRRDKILMKRQKDRCKRVLQEIQPILYQRRQMWEEREKRAIERRNRKESSEVSHRSIAEQSSNDLCITTKNDNDEMIEEIPLVTVGGKEHLHQGNGNAEEKGGNHTFGQVLLVSPKVENEDVDDSDEERLKLYKKVKQELDADEANRKELRDEDDDNDKLSDDSGNESRCFLDNNINSEFKIHFENIFPYQASNNSVQDGSQYSESLYSDGYDKSSDGYDKKGSQAINIPVVLYENDNVHSLNHTDESNGKDNNRNISDFRTTCDILEDECKGTGNEVLPVKLRKGNHVKGNDNLTEKSAVSLNNDFEDENSSSSSRSSSLSCSTGHDMSCSSSYELTSSLLSSSLTHPSATSSLSLSPWDSSYLKAYPCMVASPSNQPAPKLPQLEPAEYLLAMSAPVTPPSESSSSSDQDQPLKNVMSSETFICGDGDSSDDERCGIEWSSCGFPTIKQFSLEERVTHIHSCGLPLPGTSAISKGRMEEEVFNGIGEGQTEDDSDEGLSEDSSEEESDKGNTKNHT